MRLANIVISGTILLLGLALAAMADVIEARCDVFPVGTERAIYSGLCSYSQRQGNISIELTTGERYELSPDGDQAGNYLDAMGWAAYRESGMGEKGQIYRLAEVSVFVYWDPAPFDAASPKADILVAPN